MDPCSVSPFYSGNYYGPNTLKYSPMAAVVHLRQSCWFSYICCLIQGENCRWRGWVSIFHIYGGTIESYVQTVRSSLPVYPRVCSILSCPFLHAGQCNSRTLTTAVCGGRCVICAEVTHFDNRSAGFCHFFLLCLEQPPGWSSWSRPLSSFKKKTEDSSV